MPRFNAQRHQSVRSPQGLGAAAITAVVALSIAPATIAQYELGDGRALDQNLQQGSDGVNPRGRDFAAEVAFRNAIVTGNVGRGLSFRGDIDYTAPFDFRTDFDSESNQLEALPSNDQFAFLRDSAYSGLAVRRIRGMDALRYQFDTTTAGQTEGLGGGLIINRGGRGANVNSALGRVGLGNDASLDPFRLIDGSLRSTGAFEVNRAIEPNVLAYGRSGGQEMLMIASELQGIRSLPRRSGLFGFEEDVVVGVDPFGVGLEPEPDLGLELDPTIPAKPTEEPAEVSGVKVTERIDDKVSSHSAIMNELQVRAEKAGSRVELTPAAGPRPTDEDEAEDDSEVVTDVAPHDSYELLIQRLQTNIQDFLPDPDAEDPTDEDSGESTTGPDLNRPELHLLPDQIRGLMEDGPISIDRLLNETQTSQDIFAQHMIEGEKALGEGRWFDAEERFSAALAIEQGDSMAAVGRINAQIGAGMYKSAALNLRNLYEAYPELMTVRFTENLLPRGARLDRIRTQVRARYERPTDFGRDAAIILAYLGWQYDAPEDVIAGLDSIDQINETLGDPTLGIYRLLRELWIRPTDSE